MTGSRIRWIVTYLDGTLVGADLRIVQRSGEALAASRPGRCHPQRGLRTPAILYNGARVVDLDRGDVLYGKEIGACFDALQDAGT